MSAKYAGLPDIDTAPDVYETPDNIGTLHVDSSEEEGVAGRGARTRGTDINAVASQEELDSSPLVPTDIATKKFRNAERKREHRPRLVYAYPPSPTSDEEDSVTRPPPLSQRLRSLQHEIASLEAELSDPSNPLLHDDNGEMADPGVLMKGLLDVRSRLDKVKKTKDGRGKLIERVLKTEDKTRVTSNPSEEKTSYEESAFDLATIDKRVGELENLVGSSGTTLDESSPLPPPLLPLVTRLSNQLTLLTQPRHIDSISRRLKLLLSDLDRVSSAQVASQNRRQSQPSPDPPAPVASSLQESIQPILTKLLPILPHIPHILARLRTLSALHTSAASFQETLQNMEEEQSRVRLALDELEKAVQAVEKSLEDNGQVISSNISGLDIRVEELSKRLVDVGK